VARVSRDHSLHVQARGVLKKELMEHLRSRRSRHATAKADQRGRIPDAVSISERPVETTGVKQTSVRLRLLVALEH
jgi:hypothetical protein